MTRNVYRRRFVQSTSDLGAKVVRVFLAWPGVTLLPTGGGRYDIAQAVWKAEHTGFTDEQTWGWCRQTLAEATTVAGDFGVTLALQNHPPVIKGYADTLRMVKEVVSPHLKICFDARLEHSLDETAVRRTTTLTPSATKSRRTSQRHSTQRPLPFHLARPL